MAAGSCLPLLEEEPETTPVMSLQMCSACKNKQHGEPGSTSQTWTSLTVWQGYSLCYVTSHQIIQAHTAQWEMSLRCYSPSQSHSWRSECLVSFDLHSGRRAGGGTGSVFLCEWLRSDTRIWQSISPARPAWVNDNEGRYLSLLEHNFPVRHSIGALIVNSAASLDLLNEVNKMNCSFLSLNQYGTNQIVCDS